MSSTIIDPKNVPAFVKIGNDLYKLYTPYKQTRTGRMDIYYKNLRTGIKTRCYLARLIMMAYQNRVLDSTEHVDHIDDDKTNDVVTNLQLLTKSDNAKKQHTNNFVQYGIFICIECNKSFERNEVLVERNQFRNGNKGPFCNRKCAALFREKDKRK